MKHQKINWELKLINIKAATCSFKYRKIMLIHMCCTYIWIISWVLTVNNSQDWCNKIPINNGYRKILLYNFHFMGITKYLTFCRLHRRSSNIISLFWHVLWQPAIKLRLNIAQNFKESFDNQLLKMACIWALFSAEWTLTVGMILFGWRNLTNLSSSLKLLCSL